MPRIVAVSAVFIAVTTVLTAAGVPQKKPLAFCADAGDKAAPARLLPVDEASKQPEFFTFRARLQMALAARDVEFLISAADPHVKLGFGGEDGARRLRELLSGQDAPEMWAALARVLALGGAFRGPDAFEAPYTYSNWPEAVDAMECAAVTGANVAVRLAARTDSQVVTRTSYEIVRISAVRANSDWFQVEVRGGHKGFVRTEYLSSPLALRVIFNRINGQWRLTAFVSGD